MLGEAAPAVLGDDQRAQHRIPGVQAVVLEDDLVQVGVAEARDHAPAGARRRPSAGSRGTGAACADRGGRSRRAGPRGSRSSSRKVPTVARSPPASIVPAHAPHRSLLGVDAEEAAVGGQEELAGARSRSSEFTNGGRFEKSTSRSERPACLSGVAAAGRAERDKRPRAPDRSLHPCAAASSHSASVVNPTITPSIQYCERTASRDSG